ncbi:hypothetical protein ACGF12_36830 [Kitasatospora sp. NPDC048296]|uniref:hypothetical protein n=1 Tax=Kitasatospora sp. NPDC048296 TaxID=3364048 RepID=UPI003718903E
MLTNPLTEDELRPDERCPPPTCDLCGEPTDDEASIEVDVIRNNAWTLYLLYCSEEHLREHLSGPLPAPEPEYDPAPAPADPTDEPWGIGPGCAYAMLALAGALFLLGALEGLGVSLW